MWDRKNQESTEHGALNDTQEVLKVARQIQSQNITIDEIGQPILGKGVAKNRRISIDDPDMRHGRKSRSQRFDGYKCCSRKGATISWRFYSTKASR